MKKIAPYIVAILVLLLCGWLGWFAMKLAVRAILGSVMLTVAGAVVVGIVGFIAWRMANRRS